MKLLVLHFDAFIPGMCNNEFYMRQKRNKANKKKIEIKAEQNLNDNTIQGN